MIWAQSRGGVLGLKGALPWHLPEDLRNFRELTLGSSVVMGRATWDSLPEKFRPLPGRLNVVLTRTPGWQAPGAQCATSVQQILEQHPDCWVIGGAGVYAAMEPHASRVVRTEIDEDFEGDVFAPQLGPQWRQVSRRPAAGWSVSGTGLRFAVTELERSLM